jgi:hypothetical protein
MSSASSIPTKGICWLERPPGGTRAKKANYRIRRAIRPQRFPKERDRALRGVPTYRPRTFFGHRRHFTFSTHALVRRCQSVANSLISLQLFMNDALKKYHQANQKWFYVCTWTAEVRNES